MSEAGGTIASTRRSYSCIPCRKRKVKCNRHQPCSHCQRKGVVCVWPPNGVPLTDDGRRSPVSPTREARSPAHIASSPRSGEQSSRNIEHANHITFVSPYVSTVAQGEQLDHSILGSGNARVSHKSKGRRENSGRRFPFSSEGIETEHEYDQLLSRLPDRGEADRLLRIYLENVEWIHHPLHIPSFLAQYNTFYDGITSGQRPRLHWTALLFIVLCLGLHFGDEEDIGEEERLLEGCEDCLSAYDFLNRPTLETMQTIICLNLYLNNNDQVSTARALLATAIRLSQTMGLSRIAEESQHLSTTDLVDRELGRRIWWSLVCQDAYTASNSGMTYQVNLTHAATQPFANLDDEDVLNGRPRMPSKDFEEMTMSSYHLAKVRFALVVRDYIDAINREYPDPSYPMILDLDARFRRVFETVPRQLRPDLPQPFDPLLTSSKRYLVVQRAFMGITLHNRILRLHRAYMTRGYDDEHYAYSTQACLTSAYELLGLVRQCRTVLCRWWVVIVHVWTSGLVISVDSLRGRQDVDSRRHRRAGMELAISLLEPITRSSPVAERGVKVLRSILSQMETDTPKATPVRPELSPNKPPLSMDDPNVGDDLNSDRAPISFDGNTLAMLESLFAADFSDWSTQVMDSGQFMGSFDLQANGNFPM